MMNKRKELLKKINTRHGNLNPIHKSFQSESKKIFVL